jgi:mycothiol synthase
VEISRCTSDDDYEAWRAVRLAVVPSERCDTVAELRAQERPSRLLLLASDEGVVVGSGMADRSEVSGGAYVVARVLPAHRRRGVGTALVAALTEHAASLDVPQLRTGVADDGSLAFARGLGFEEVDRQVEQVRDVRDEPAPGPSPAGVEVVLLAERPGLWAASYDTFGREVMADFALFSPLEVSAEQWAEEWAGDPMFLAVHEGVVVGCAGLHLDADRPERAEHSLTGVRRTWRGRGLAALLKRHTLHWAANHGVTQVYTWTQAGNTDMLRLNEHLGYAVGVTESTLAKPLEGAAW